MIFSVLCLTIFAVLSLVTTNSDLRLSTKAAKSIQDYYAAEYAAETKVIGIRDALRKEGSPVLLPQSFDVEVSLEENGESSISFVQNVDSRRDLYVILHLDVGGKLSVSAWRLGANENWSADGGISLWSETNSLQG